MWKKDEEDAQPPTHSREKPTVSNPSKTATIGSSITIRGEVSGDEDLLIQGHVDGSVDLQEHAVTVGTAGQVTASISARVVTVEGTVNGDIVAQEQVILRNSAEVEGDITAPRVVLEDGARFRGGVDMGDGARPGSARSTSSASRNAATTSSTSTSSKNEKDGAAKDDRAKTSSSSGSTSGSTSGSSRSATTGKGSN